MSTIDLLRDMARASVEQARVAVCMPMTRRGGIHPLTHRSIVNLQLPEGNRFLDIVDMPVDEARNRLVRAALSLKDVTHVLFIDSDMVFSSDAAMRLLKSGYPVVGGLCHNRRHPFQPVLMREQSHGDTDNGYAYMYDYDLGHVKVDATGAAFLLIARNVFEQITLRPQLGEWFAMRARFSEDVSFCQRVKEAGFPIFVDTTVQVGHVAEVIVNPDFARRNRNVYLNPWSPNAE